MDSRSCSGSHCHDKKHYGHHIRDRDIVYLGRIWPCVAMTGRRTGYYDNNTFYIYVSKAFIAYQIGYGMAIALFILAIGILLSLVYIRLIRANDGN